MYCGKPWLGMLKERDGEERQTMVYTLMVWALMGRLGLFLG